MFTGKVHEIISQNPSEEAFVLMVALEERSEVITDVTLLHILPTVNSINVHFG